VNTWCNAWDVATSPVSKIVVPGTGNQCTCRPHGVHTPQLAATALFDPQPLTYATVDSTHPAVNCAHQTTGALATANANPKTKDRIASIRYVSGQPSLDE
jgi:hypothetical protein